MIDLEQIAPEGLTEQIRSDFNLLTPDEQVQAVKFLDELRRLLAGSASPDEFARQLHELLRTLHTPHVTRPGLEWYCGDEPQRPPEVVQGPAGVHLSMFFCTDPLYTFKFEDDEWRVYMLEDVSFISAYTPLRYKMFDREAAPVKLWWELFTGWDSIMGAPSPSSTVRP